MFAFAARGLARRRPAAPPLARRGRRAVAPAPRAPAADARAPLAAPRVGRNGTTGPRQAICARGATTRDHRQPRREFPLGAGLGSAGTRSCVVCTAPAAGRAAAAGARHLSSTHVSDDAERAAVFHMARVDGRSTCTCLPPARRAASVERGPRPPHARGPCCSSPRLPEDARARARGSTRAARGRARAARATLRGLGRARARGPPMTPRSRGRPTTAVRGAARPRARPPLAAAAAPARPAARAVSPLLTAAVRAEGWPPVEAVRGKFAFALLESGAAGWKQGGIGALSARPHRCATTTTTTTPTRTTTRRRARTTIARRRPGNLGRSRHVHGPARRLGRGDDAAHAMLKHDNPRSSPADGGKRCACRSCAHARTVCAARRAARRELARATAARAAARSRPRLTGSLTRKGARARAARRRGARDRGAAARLICAPRSRSTCTRTSVRRAELEASGPGHIPPRSLRGNLH